MENSPLVSVIVPVYNTPKKYLEECFNSIRRQDYGYLEVIVVDDGSDQATNRFIKKYVARATKGSQSWTLVQQDNKGLSAARNAGYEVAVGEYVQFLDSDDFFNSKLIATAIKIAEENNADVVVENFEIYDTQTQARTLSIEPNIFPTTPVFRLVDLKFHKIGVIPYSTWSKLFRKSYLDKYNIRHNESLRRAEDVPFSYAALVLADRIALLPNAYITYRDNLAMSNTATNDNFPTDSIKAWEKLYQFLVANDLYSSLKEDFDAAMVGSVYWHLERLRTTEGAYQLGNAAVNFMDHAGIVSKSDHMVAIALASTRPELIEVLRNRDEKMRLTQQHIANIEHQLTQLREQLRLQSRPGIGFAAKKLASAVVDKILQTKTRGEQDGNR